MSSYFSFITDILCGLCSHSSSGAAEMLQRLLRGPRGPLPGATWTGTTPLVTLPKCFHWLARNMLDAAPKRGCSQTQPEPKLNQAWTGGERCGFCWQRSASCCESDSFAAAWAWIIEGLVMMVMAKRLYSLLPLPAVDRRSRCSRPARMICLKMTVMMMKWWHHRIDWFHSTSSYLNTSAGFIWPISPAQLSLFTVLPWVRWWFQLLRHIMTSQRWKNNPIFYFSKCCNTRV